MIGPVDLPQRLREIQGAFDSVADVYDGPVGNNALIQHLRGWMWRTVAQGLSPGSSLLDLGCGTGLDAVHLAARGHRVLAIDWSAAMVERARRRAEEAGLSDRVTVRHLGIHELDRLAEGPFDVLYSDLGPLNCVPDLEAAAARCGALLKPGGRLVVSVIGRHCPWEVLFYLLRGNAARARVRARPGPVPVPLNGETVWTHYYAPRAFYRAFASHFELTGYRALGLFLPPPYLIRLHERMGPLARLLARLDDRLGALPGLRNGGDHFLMTLTRRDGTSAST